MKSELSDNAVPFVNRRNNSANELPTGRERRQFANNYDSLSSEARELALAIDRYKLEHRRRFVTYEEMLSVLKQLGYGKLEGAAQANA